MSNDKITESSREPYDAMGPVDAPNPPAARATLADVQPGGRVRLGDQAERARFEAWASEHNYSVATDGDQYEFAAARLMWKAWRAAFASGAAAAVTGAVLVNMGDSEAEFIRANDEEATLSAQPSPGGQDAQIDALADDVESCVSDACGYLASDSGWDDYGIYRDDAAERYRALPDRIRTLVARQSVGEPVDEPSGKGKRKVKAVVSQDDLHKILYLIHALKNIGNKVWLKHDIHADDYRAATINDAAKVANGAIDLLTRAYSALSGARADARVSRSAPGDAWIYADLNELSPHDVAILHDMRDHMAARTMSLSDWHAFGPPVLDRVLALIDNDHAHWEAAPPAQAVDLGKVRQLIGDLRTLDVKESTKNDNAGFVDLRCYWALLGVAGEVERSMADSQAVGK